MSYQIKTVSEMVGIPKNTLIAWERRHNVVTPDRSDSGYRRYSEEDVRTLLRVKELINAGYRISEAVDMVRTQPLAPLPAADAAFEAPLERLGSSLEACLLGFDRSGADQLALRMVDLSFVDRLHRIYLPLIQRIGDGWEAGEVSVAQEHFASGWLREQLFVMMSALSTPRANAQVAVCATASGERHEFGILSVAILLALRGWKVVYLGVDAPADEVGAVVDDLDVKLIAASVVLERDAAITARWLTAVRERVGPDLPVILGGRAANLLASESFAGRTAIASNLDDVGGATLEAWIRQK